jgi:hypothetical protein
MEPDDSKNGGSFPFISSTVLLFFFHYLQLWLLDKLRRATNYTTQSDIGEDKRIITTNLFISFIFELWYK